MHHIVLHEITGLHPPLAEYNGEKIQKVCKPQNSYSK